MRHNPFIQRDTHEVAAAIIRETLAAALKMPPGVERDRLMRKARQEQTHEDLAAWAFSSGLQGPT